MFGKQSESFGLDIGSSAVKVIQIRESGGTRTLTGFGMVSLPNDTITDGAINDPGTVADAVKEAVAKAGVKGSDAAISICGRELIIKKIQIPEVPPKEIGDVVRLEAEHHIPFAIDEVFLDHHTVGKHNGQLDLILVAVKKAKVSDYMNVVEQAGFSPTIVDVDGFALGNQFEANFPGEDDEAVALIDIGASIMKTNVLRKGATIFARDIPFGGNNYTQAIAQRLNISFEQAEAAKLGKDVGVKWETLVPPLEAVSRDLSLEVQRTFDYFASTAESERIGKIVLAGGCAQLPGPERVPVVELGHPGGAGPTVPADPGRVCLRRGSQRAGAGAGRRRRTRAAAAQRQGRGQMIRINLAPPETRHRRRSFSLPVPSMNLGLLFGVLFALAAGGVGYFWWSLSAEETQIAGEVDRLNRELQSLKATLGQSAGVKAQLAEAKRRVGVLEDLTKGQGKSIILLDAFIDTVPRDLWITSLEQKETQLKLSGTAFSTAAVSDFMSNLKSSGKFKDVEIVVSRQALDKTPSLVTFEVTCKFEG